MFCTVVVVWPAESKVSGATPRASERDEPPPSPDDAAGSAEKLQAPRRSRASTTAAKDLIRTVRPRAVVLMGSCFDEVVRCGRSELWGVLRDHRAYLGEVAGAGVAVAEAVDELGLLLGADLLGLGAGGPEVAAGRRVRRARRVAGEDDPLAGSPLAR